MMVLLEGLSFLHFYPTGNSDSFVLLKSSSVLSLLADYMKQGHCLVHHSALSVSTWGKI
jgi:hypothetical protein